VVVLDLTGGGRALLIFTDDDLATTFAEKGDIIGKTAKCVTGGPHILALLQHCKRLGMTHVAVDATPGKRASTCEIDKAIQDAEQQVSRFPSPRPDDD
jgi:hypothetical protein